MSPLYARQGTGTFLVTHYLQPQSDGWPRRIEIYMEAGGGLLFEPRAYRTFDDGSLSWRPRPTAVSEAEIAAARRTAQLYVTQVLMGRGELLSSGHCP